MKKRFFIYIGFIIIVITLLFTIYYYKKQSRNVIERLAESNKIINILIAGNNIYNDNKHRFYSIMSYNPENGKIGLTFIPPDFRINLDSRKNLYSKIDDVDINDFKKLTDSLAADLGLDIPFYIVIYSLDVKRLVDLIEGIDIYVLDQIDGMHGVTSGLNYFDGEKVLKYIFQGNGSIFGRYDRIQDILLTVFYNRDRYKKFINIDFISEVIRTVKTNFLPQELISLLEMLYKDKTDLTCTVLPGTFDKDGFYCLDEISNNMYKNDFLKYLITGNSENEAPKIKVLNGTSVGGLAKKIRNILTKEGLNVVEFGTSPYPEFEHSIIINRKGGMEPVLKVSKLIGVDRIYHIIDSTQLNNVLLIVGNDLAK